MKTIELLAILKQYPLFTENDISKVLLREPSYVRKRLYELKKKGLIFGIERGKYTVYENPFIFASYLYRPAYISLWSIFQYYNFTEQLPNTLFVMTPNAKRPLNFGKVRIEFTKTKYFFGYRKEKYQGFDIFIAEPEKAVIDSLLSKKVPLDEILKAIRSKRLDITKLMGYALKIKQSALAKRLGFILESEGYECNKLKKLVDNNYICVDLMLKRKGKKSKKWMVIDNR